MIRKILLLSLLCSAQLTYSSNPPAPEQQPQAQEAKVSRPFIPLPDELYDALAKVLASTRAYPQKPSKQISQIMAFEALKLLIGPEQACNISICKQGNKSLSHFSIAASKKKRSGIRMTP